MLYRCLYLRCYLIVSLFCLALHCAGGSFGLSGGSRLARIGDRHRNVHYASPQNSNRKDIYIHESTKGKHASKTNYNQQTNDHVHAPVKKVPMSKPNFSIIRYSMMSLTSFRSDDDDDDDVDDDGDSKDTETTDDESTDSNFKDIASAIFMYILNASPETVIAWVKAISLKLMAGLPVNFIELAVWEGAAGVIYSLLGTSDCDEFLSLVYLKQAACCRVLVSDEYFGFCTLKYLIEDYGAPETSVRIPKRSRYFMMHMTGRGKTMIQIQRKSGIKTWLWKADAMKNLATYAQLGSIKPTESNALGFISYRSTEITPEIDTCDVVYIDLWAVPCSPPLDLSLCSQYCCSADNNDSAFCNSELECY